jgi:hypothetical protein
VKVEFPHEAWTKMNKDNKKERFGKNINKLILRRNEANLNLMLGNSIMKKVIVDLTCLASMKSKID